MEFGLFMELSVPRPWTPGSERQVYANALEQVRLADELGFDYVWAVEHHFLEEYSHCSAPDLFLTACAMQTTRIRVGHGIVACVPQYQSPIRVAERSAALDILSGGRVELGTDARPPGPSSQGSAPTPTKRRRPGTSSSASFRRCGRRSGSVGTAARSRCPSGRCCPSPSRSRILRCGCR